MKKTQIFAAIAAMTLAGMAFAFNAGAQDKKENGAMKEKVKAERVAFITARVDLTVAEAEKFWPVYNEICKRRDAATAAEREAFRKLRETVKENREGEIPAAMKEYTRTADNNQRTLGKDAEALSRILPPHKVAKVLIAEEQFRRHQINRLHKGKKGDGPQAHRIQPKHKPTRYAMDR